ncbi:SRPBCC family protein [Massilia sp. DD77]|uniref:SRPBCC family protein n=1 Tax=Massilia sp. DD77 TaxID=3109349 RepID=UPI002FFDE47E
MKFEHLVEINDPMNPLVDTLTREQLWRGLVLRAESPMMFMPHLDECQILDREAGSFGRRLRYGELVIEDRVHLTPLQEVRVEVPPQGEIAASSLRMIIESPTNAMLLVRFCYDDGTGEHTDEANAMYDEFKKSAYQEADIDTVRILRQLAAEGKLDASLLN